MIAIHLPAAVYSLKERGIDEEEQRADWPEHLWYKSVVDTRTKQGKSFTEYSTDDKMNRL